MAVVKYPIANYCLYLSIDFNSKKQLMPILSLQVSIGKLYNIMVSPPEEVGMKEARYANNKIIISDSTLLNIISPQLKKITSQYKFMCQCECYIFSKSIHSSLLSWRERLLINLNIKVIRCKTDGLVKWPIFYSIHINLCHSTW